VTRMESADEDTMNGAMMRVETNKSRADERKHLVLQGAAICNRRFGLVGDCKSSFLKLRGRSE
jgi:hypothetical protein